MDATSTSKAAEIPEQPRLAHAFSLIELLVVICVLSLLAALLFPIFASAREKARQTTCTSNLRQPGAATMQYVQDNDGRFFPLGTHLAGATGSFIKWDAFYLTGGSSADHSRSLLGTYCKGEDIFYCPSADVRSGYTSYGVNKCLGDSTNGQNYLSHAHFVAAVQVPTDTILFTDYAVPGMDNILHPPSENILEHDDVSGRHSGLACVAFVDGHVQALRPVLLAKDGPPAGSDPHWGVLLRGPYTGIATKDDYYYEMQKPAN